MLQHDDALFENLIIAHAGFGILYLKTYLTTLLVKEKSIIITGIISRAYLDVC